MPRLNNATAFKVIVYPETKKATKVASMRC